MSRWNVQINSPRYESSQNFDASTNVFYSQYSQDRSLESCIFKGYKNGVFMDVGAHDGVDLNNTLYFEKTNNWKGINIEPIKSVYERLTTNRPNSININCAVNDINGPCEFVCNSGYTEMLSGLKSEYDERHMQRITGEIASMGGFTEVVLMNGKRIETICEEHNVKHINYLSIDVEGGEMKVLNSINFNKLFIDVIGFENNYPDKEDIPIKFLEDKGYIKLPNHVADIFMIHRDSEFVKNCHDLI
jgi:FkbM family methyltransferase